MTIAYLIDYLKSAKEQGWPDGGDDIREEGIKSGYPPCCVEWFTNAIPGIWAENRRVEAYWDLLYIHDKHRGYIACPECLGLPLDTELIVNPTAGMARRLGLHPMRVFRLEAKEEMQREEYERRKRERQASHRVSTEQLPLL
jgi:hypothetical protein